MANVVQQYLDIFEHAQQRWLDIQADYWRSVFSAPPLVSGCTRQHMSSRLEEVLSSGASLVRVSADMQNDLQVLGERWVGRQQKQWASYLNQMAAPSGLVPLDAGLSSYLIASRAARQIHHFASTQLSSAPLHAMRGGQKAYRKSIR